MLDNLFTVEDAGANKKLSIYTEVGLRDRYKIPRCNTETYYFTGGATPNGMGRAAYGRVGIFKPLRQSPDSSWFLDPVRKRSRIHRERTELRQQ